MKRPATKTRMIHARIEPQLKKSAERVFSTIGISTTEAIRLFLKQVQLHKGLPFPVLIPTPKSAPKTFPDKINRGVEPSAVIRVPPPPQRVSPGTPKRPGSKNKT